MLDWNEVRLLTAGHTPQQSRVVLLDYFRKHADEITATDIVVAPDGMRELCYQVFDGWQDPRTRNEEQAIHGGRKFRLHVLTGFAVGSIGEDGTPKFCDDTVTEFEGKAVPWKIGNVAMNDRGTRMTSADRNQYALQGRPHEIWKEYKIDSEHCISVPFSVAYSMISRYGKRISFPNFVRPRPNEKDVDGNPVKRINNWRFEEVPADFKRSRTTGQTKGNVVAR